MLTEKARVLQDRYRLTTRLSTNSQCESWLAVDQDGGEVLVRAWPYEGDKPPEVVRALWDRELRNLFRLSSSPDADSKLVVLRDAGVDRHTHCFLMAFGAGFCVSSQSSGKQGEV